MKTLNELVKEFKGTARELREKIKSRISDLEEESGAIRSGIEAETSKLVAAELANNAVDQGECRRALFELRQKLAEADSLLEAYTNEPRHPGHNALALESIRTAAARERAVRLEKVKTLTAAREDTERQIELLKAQAKQLQADIDRAHTDVEVNVLKCVLHHINPEAVSLPDFQQQRFVKCWIAGDSEGADACLRVPRGPREEQPFVYTRGEPIKPTEPAGSRCIERTVHVFGEGEQKIPV